MYPRVLQRFDNLLVNKVEKYANRKWYKAPLTNKILASEKEYLSLWEKAKSSEYNIIDNFEKELNFTINYDWYHQLALQTQIVKKKSNICYVHGRLLYSQLQNYMSKNKEININILETGTARGFSTLCMAKALNDIDAKGKIITFDVIPHHHKMYWNCIADHKGKQTRAELLHDYKELTEKYILFHQGNTKTELHKLQTDRIHFAFLDSAHTYNYLMAEFLNIKEKQQKGDIVFFDDYTPNLFSGVVKAVNEICDRYNYSKKIIQVNSNRGYVIAEKL